MTEQNTYSENNNDLEGLFSERLNNLKPYPFVEISRIIAQKRSEGIEIITFGIGDPDIPTPKPIIERLISASQKAPNHRYPETDGLPETRKAISNWYKTRFAVDLDPNSEVLPLIGGKEGIGHIPLCFLNPGDLAIIPDPAYPVYKVGTMFAGAEIHTMPIVESNSWLPDLQAIPDVIAHKAKIMWLNYPNNPTSAIADRAFFERVIAFAKAYNIIILHDAAYSEVVYDGYKALSFMEIPGAKQVGVEFHSLSKCFNMTGWRFGSVVGNSKVVEALFKIKSNLDSGIPQAIQEMGIEALTGDQTFISHNNSIYQTRRDKLVTGLRKLGLDVDPPKASLYLWVKIPMGYKSATFAAKLLDDTGIVVTPGSSYGDFGEGYIRLSLTTPDIMIEKALDRLGSWNLPDPVEG